MSLLSELRPLLRNIWSQNLNSFSSSTFSASSLRAASTLSSSKDTSPSRLTRSFSSDSSPPEGGAANEEKSSSRAVSEKDASSSGSSSSQSRAGGARKRGGRFSGPVTADQDAPPAFSKASTDGYDPYARWGRLPTRTLPKPQTKYEQELYESAPPYRPDNPGAPGRQVGEIVSADVPRPVLCYTPQGLRWKRGRAFRGRTIPVRALNLEVNYKLGTAIVLAPSWTFVANYPNVFPFSETTLS